VGAVAEIDRHDMALGGGYGTDRHRATLGGGRSWHGAARRSGHRLGHHGAKLADGNTAIALLCNTLATGAILVVITTILAPISGAHFNPAVSLVMAIRGELDRGEAAAYMVVQIIGGCLGALFAHLMFGLDPFQLSTTARTGLPQWFAEFVATFGLVVTILGCVRFRPDAVAFAVGLYITSAYWFTASKILP